MNVQVQTDIKLNDCDKHVQTDCKNDHSTSKVLGHVTRHSINLISTSARAIVKLLHHAILALGEGCNILLMSANFSKARSHSCLDMLLSSVIDHTYTMGLSCTGLTLRMHTRSNCIALIPLSQVAISIATCIRKLFYTVLVQSSEHSPTIE